MFIYGKKKKIKDKKEADIVKNRAFTLTELIAVIVIIGLILLTAVPAVYKLLLDNKNEKYEYYYKMVKEASEVYANTQKDLLGNSLNQGCISITVNDLVSGGFLKPYNKDGETVSDSQIIISNNYGSITFDIYLKIGTFEKGEKKTGYSCSGYILNNTLFETLKSNDNSKPDDKGYITGTDNYIWYSGKLWRAIFVKNNKVELVTDKIVGVVPFGDSSQFKDSYVEKWLNEYFLNTLYNPSKYLTTYNWMYRGTSYSSSKKVGLISKNDIDNVSYLNDSSYNWSLTYKDGSNVYINNGNTVSYSSVYGVRPAIFLKENVRIAGGTGTVLNPYQLEGNKIEAIENKKLNTRYSGEYVSINNKKYRIVDVLEGKTKLITVDSYDNKTMDDIFDNKELIYKGLDTTSFSTLLTKGDFYLGDSSNSINYVFGNVNTNIKALNLGIPTYGELVYFTSLDINKEFWTLTADYSDSSKMVGITADGRKTIIGRESTKSVKYLLFIDENVTIKSGKGIENEPFVIEEDVS